MNRETRETVGTVMVGKSLKGNHSAVPSTPPACVAEPGFLPPKDGSLLYNLRQVPNDEEIAANVQQALNWFQTSEMWYAKGQPERASWWAAGASAAMLKVMLCARVGP